MVSGVGASQASPQGLTEPLAAKNDEEGDPHSLIRSIVLGTASPEHDGLPSIFTVSTGRTNGDSQNEARLHSLNKYMPLYSRILLESGFRTWPGMPPMLLMVKRAVLARAGRRPPMSRKLAQLSLTWKTPFHRSHLA